MDPNTLTALKHLTISGTRDLLVLLPDAYSFYGFLAEHLTLPILVVTDGSKREHEEAASFVLCRKLDHEITLPCRPGSMEDLINLSAALALLDGVAASGCRAVLVNMAPDRKDCTIVLKEITESSFEKWHGVMVSPALSLRRVVREVLAVAMELGRMRKRPTGGMYLIGDTKEVLARSTQLIVNPFQGQAREQRDVSAPHVRDSLREYARLDGAVIIDEDGLVQAAGTHVNADTRNVTLLIEGARHATAAAITHETQTIAVTVSEKTGTVMIFKAGEVILTVTA
jgi:DNA integrity scanning protein DisA with diadenylate cyclase activity